MLKKKLKSKVKLAQAAMETLLLIGSAVLIAIVVVVVVTGIGSSGSEVVYSLTGTYNDLLKEGLDLSGAVCGNGLKEAGEFCDWSDISDNTCSEQDKVCDTDCLNCIDEEPVEPVCGNNIVEVGEDCEPPLSFSCKNEFEGFYCTADCLCEEKIVSLTVCDQTNDCINDYGYDSFQPEVLDFVFVGAKYLDSKGNSIPGNPGDAGSCSVLFNDFYGDNSVEMDYDNSGVYYTAINPFITGDFDYSVSCTTDIPEQSIIVQSNFTINHYTADITVDFSKQLEKFESFLTPGLSGLGPTANNEDFLYNRYSSFVDEMGSNFHRSEIDWLYSIDSSTPPSSWNEWVFALDEIEFLHSKNIPVLVHLSSLPIELTSCDSEVVDCGDEENGWNPGKYYPPNNERDFKDFILGILYQYDSRGFDFSKLVFTFGNEPDLALDAGPPDYMGPNWVGNEQSYFDTYKWFVEAVREFELANNVDVLVGGPEANYWPRLSELCPNEIYLNCFLETVEQDYFPDYLTFHHYGADFDYFGREGDGEELEGFSDLSAHLDSAGFNGKIIISEWGSILPSSMHCDWRRDSLYGAGYVLNNLYYLRQGASRMSQDDLDIVV
ncbi:MAG: hypothetical protein ABH821_06350 [archaeon]